MPRFDDVASGPRLRVGFILAENFTLSAFSLLADHLRLAADKGDSSRPIHCSWRIMAASQTPVRSSCGVAVARDSVFDDPAAFDYVVVVGGILHGRRQVCDATLAYIRQLAAASVTLIGVCTGTFVLCRAGVMDGREVCVSWYHRQDFQDAFPGHRVVSDKMFVDDGDRITCSGGNGAADVALHLIERRLGRAVASKASHILLHDRTPRGTATALQPDPPIMPQSSGLDPRVRRAVMRMEQNMADPVPIAQLAAGLDISSRQLERLFQASVGRKPQDFYRLIRLRYARALLQRGDMSITEVALETGFADCAHFSRHFKAAFGVNASTVRRTRQIAAQPSLSAAFCRPAALAGVRIFEE